MKNSRRSFIKSSIVVGSGIIVAGGMACNRRQKFSPQLGVCTGLNHADMLADMEYTYIEETVGGFLMPDKPEEEFLANLEMARKSKIPVKACNVFIPGSLKSVGPEAVHDRIVEYVTTAFRRAQMAGVEVIVFGSGGSRRIPDGFTREQAFDQFVTLGKRIAPIAGKHNVLIALEPLNTKECNFINSVSYGAEIVHAVGHKNYRLLADMYHMKMEDEDPGNIGRNKDIIVHVHIAEKQDRAAPGTNGEDFTPYFRELARINYKGAISVECRWEDMSVQAPVALATIRDHVQRVSS